MTRRRNLSVGTTADTGQLPLGLATEGQHVLAAGRQRAALTKAVRSGDTDRIVLACRDAVHEWNEPGAMWPDDWTTWQRALDNTLPWNATVDIGDL
jgi:hypothetical protein